ncbi:hypothetical protein JCM3766R1_000259 [Sporobolomyces carnicolor]
MMQTSVLEDLPSELLLHLLSFLSLRSLLALSCTSRNFHSLVESTILPRFALNRLHYSPVTLRHLQNSWTWGKKALWADRVERRWASNSFSAVSFGSWDRTMPAIKLWQVEPGLAGVLIARGSGLEWWVALDHAGTMNRVEVISMEDELGVKGGYGQARRRAKNALDDITALAEGPRSGEIILARVSGVVQRLRVRRGRPRGGPGDQAIVLEETARYLVPRSDLARPGSTSVQALTSSPAANLLVSASTTRLRPPNLRQVEHDENDSLARALMKRAAPKTHQVALHSIVSPWEPAEVIPLSSKPWSVQVAPGPKPPWIAIGQSGTTPVSLVHLDSTGRPDLSTLTPLARTLKPTSVYSLTTPAIDCSPFLRPDQTLIAAFFDSTTRVYDLRLPPDCASSTSLVTSNWDDQDPLSSSPNEIMRLSDPWSDDPSYSVACGGPCGAQVAVGSARNSAVRIFDVRGSTRPISVARTKQQRDDEDGGSRGITAFGPRGDRSPVYGLSIENSRIWAVTDRSAFVFNLHADERDARREESVSFVGHTGEGKGELRKTGTLALSRRFEQVL